MIKPEILAPTGTIESVIAALNGGCDAIYIGGKCFSARAYANNPSEDSLKDIVKICSLRGVKVFVTINTLYKENELKDVLSFVNEIYSYGVYGVIVQDIGIAGEIKKQFPNLKLSASTQMTIHNSEGVKLMSELGYDRVVLARELNENEIEEICSLKGNTEIEGFIHGALCVCYSGRCLMSSFIGGRSGNRGRCAQPCRKEYSLYKNSREIKRGYLLSPKDISTLDILPKIVNSGLDSLKIEGRMKSPEYVYQVVSLYRKYIDNISATPTESDKKAITQIFNRGGSSSHGYWDSYSGEAMMSNLTPKSSGIEIGKVTDYNGKSSKCTIRLFENIVPGDGIEIWSKPHVGTGINRAASKGETIALNIKGRINKGDKVYRSFDKALNDSLKKTYIRLTRQMPVAISVRAFKNQPFTLYIKDYNIEVKGEIVTEAQNRPLSKEDIINKITKTGDTPFSFTIEEIDLGENIYIPISALNNTRREACNILEEEIIKRTSREKITPSIEYQKPVKSENPKITVAVKTEEQFKAAIDSKADIIYSSILDKDFIKIAKEAGKSLYYSLPNISRDGYDKYIFEGDFEGYVVKSYGKINTNKKIICDYSLNIMNSLSLKRIREIYGAEIVCLSPELNLKELREIADENCEIIVYGSLPLMTTHQCPVGLYEGKKGNGKYCSKRFSKDSYYISDSKKINFPILRDCEGCIAYVLNSVPIHTLDKYNDILSIGAGYHRIELTTEDYSTSLNIINSYVTKGSFEIEASTKGHYYRGVQ